MRAYKIVQKFNKNVLKQGASSTYHEKSAQDEATLAELNRLGEGGLWLM